MKLNVAIPCYEMGGWGSRFLQYSLDKLKQQTFKDFQVVISDNSENNAIEKLVSINEDLNIKYVRNEKNNPSMAKNFNRVMRECDGEVIKILCQDDYLLDENSLKKTMDNFEVGTGWLVSAYYHTYNRKEYTSLHVPSLSKNIYLENLIGTPSCLTVLNGTELEFDENLQWYVDCDFYYRVYLKYGSPKILTYPTVAQFLWNGQVTNKTITSEIIRSEKDYLVNKYEKD
jgi:glycosyltransferase involved in cell wall biosynthesis